MTTHPDGDRPEQAAQPHGDPAAEPADVVVLGGDDAREQNPATMVEQPAKVMRLGTMLKQLLDEVREAPLDDAARTRLAAIHERSLAELEEGLSPALVAELHRITLPFSDDAVPTDAELRVAQAQLVGWLEGLFHGIQTAMVAQQLATQAQSGGARALPPGVQLIQRQQAQPRPAAEDGRPTPGQYL